jgi:BirA family transcriptional regulator, biotin operon repressor / biotin---[acetyl-CoA-carboxylase] ligase
MHLADPRFPPLLTGHPVKAPARAFDEACRLAALGELGAGDLVWSRNTHLAEAALILEPEVPRQTARQMLPLLQVALADALGGLVPPQTAVQVRWPGGLLLNGGVVGETTIAVAPGPAADVPAWLVVGFCLQLSAADARDEPGARANETTFYEEACGDITRTEILEAFGAHVMAWLHTWGEEGFRPIHNQWIGRVEGYEMAAPFALAGASVNARVLGLDDTVQLIVKPAGGPPVTLPMVVL